MGDEKLREKIKVILSENISFHNEEFGNSGQIPIMDIDIDKAAGQLLALIEQEYELTKTDGDIPLGTTCHIDRDKLGRWWIVWGADFFQDKPNKKLHPEGIWLEDVYQRGLKEHEPICFYCGQKPDRSMLTMGKSMAHATCVIGKLNELLDPDYEGSGEPIEIIGFLSRPALVRKDHGNDEEIYTSGI